MSLFTLRRLSLTPRPGLDLPADHLEHDPLEAVVEGAVDDEVHDAVEHEEEVVDRRRADEPDGREEGVAASDHQVHFEDLVEVQKEARQVRHEEHAHDADQDHGQLEVLGLED